MAFYDATEIEERERFLQSCDYISGTLGYDIMNLIHGHVTIT